MFASWAVDFALQLLSPSRGREWLRWVFGTPAAVIMLLVTFGGAVLGVAMSLFVWFLAIMLPLITGARHAFPDLTTQAPLYFVGLLALTTLAAYMNDRLLLPLKWFNYFSSGPADDIARDTFGNSVVVVRLINFRRLAYILAIGAYFASLVAELSGVEFGHAIDSLPRVTTAALLAFLSVDAYVSAFHPSLVGWRPPLEYKFGPNRRWLLWSQRKPRAPRKG